MNIKKEKRCVYVRYKNGSHCERKLTRILRYVFSGHRWRYIERKSTSTLLFMRIDRARAYTPFDSRSFFSLFKCSSSSIVVCCLFTCTDRPLLHIPSPSLYFFFFPVQLITEKLSEILMCATIDRSYSCSFFQVFIWQAMRQKEWERADIDYDQFPLSLYVYNR